APPRHTQAATPAGRGGRSAPWTDAARRRQEVETTRKTHRNAVESGASPVRWPGSATGTARRGCYATRGRMGQHYAEETFPSHERWRSRRHRASGLRRATPYTPAPDAARKITLLPRGAGEP